MLNLALALLLSATQAAPPQPAPPENGIIAGSLVVPEDVKVSNPVLILLLGPRHLERWNSDAQRRIDVYWERYKPAFAQRKEFFMEISRQAYRDSIVFTANQLRRESPEVWARYVREIPADGKFEFTNLPMGMYKILALARNGEQALIWQETLEIESAVPQFIQVKKQIP